MGKKVNIFWLAVLSLASYADETPIRVFNLMSTGIFFPATLKMQGEISLAFEYGIGCPFITLRRREIIGTSLPPFYVEIQRKVGDQDWNLSPTCSSFAVPKSACRERSYRVFLDYTAESDRIQLSRDCYDRGAGSPAFHFTDPFFTPGINHQYRARIILDPLGDRRPSNYQYLCTPNQIPSEFNPDQTVGDIRNSDIFNGVYYIVCASGSENFSLPTQNTSNFRAASAMRSDGATVRLDWNPAGFAAGYRVEQLQSNGRYHHLGECSFINNACELYSLEFDTLYSFRLSYLNPTTQVRVGSYQYVSVQTPSFPKPAAPSNLRILSRSSTWLQLQWKDNSTREDAFEIERATGDGDFTLVSNAVYPNSFLHTDRNLLPGTRYRYRVRSRLGDTRSDYSPEVTTETNTLPPGQALLLSPSGLIGSVISIGPSPSSGERIVSVALSWNDNSDRETGFDIFRKEDPNVEFSKINGRRLPANTTEFIDRTALKGRRYFYQVRAYFPNGFKASETYAQFADPFYLDRGLLCRSFTGAQTYNVPEVRDRSIKPEYRDFFTHNEFPKIPSSPLSGCKPNEQGFNSQRTTIYYATDFYSGEELSTAASAVSLRGNSIVIFPQGEYRIDRVINLGSENDLEHSTARDAKRIRFVGCGDAVINVKGDFDRDLNQDAVQPFRLINVTEATIEGFEINGNVQQARRNLTDLREGSGAGIFTSGCKDCLFRDLNLHHFGLDGIYLGQGLAVGQGCPEKIADENIRIHNVQAHNNARLNLFVVQAQNVWVSNSEFLAAGFTGSDTSSLYVDNPNFPGLMPMAGIDVEPNIFTMSADQKAGYPEFRVNSATKNILFENVTAQGKASSFIASLGRNDPEWDVARTSNLRLRFSRFIGPDQPISTNQALVGNFGMAVENGRLENSEVFLNDGEMVLGVHIGSSLYGSRNDALISTQLIGNRITSKNRFIDLWWGRFPYSITDNEFIALPGSSCFFPKIRALSPEVVKTDPGLNFIGSGQEIRYIETTPPRTLEAKNLALATIANTRSRLIDTSGTRAKQFLRNRIQLDASCLASGTPVDAFVFAATEIGGNVFQTTSPALSSPLLRVNYQRGQAPAADRPAGLDTYSSDYLR